MSQVTKATNAHDKVSKQLVTSEQTLADKSQQLSATKTILESTQAELSKLGQQHEALILQHERTEGELSDLKGVLKEKQRAAEGLQSRQVTYFKCTPLGLLLALVAEQFVGGWRGGWGVHRGA